VKGTIIGPARIEDVNYLTIGFTDFIRTIESYHIVLGTDNGTVIQFDALKREYVGINDVCPVFEDYSQVGTLSIKAGFIVLADQNGCIKRYPIEEDKIQPVSSNQLSC